MKIENVFNQKKKIIVDQFWCERCCGSEPKWSICVWKMERGGWIVLKMSRYFFSRFFFLFKLIADIRVCPELVRLAACPELWMYLETLHRPYSYCHWFFYSSILECPCDNVHHTQQSICIFLTLPLFLISYCNNHFMIIYRIDIQTNTRRFQSLFRVRFLPRMKCYIQTSIGWTMSWFLFLFSSLNSVSSWGSCTGAQTIE